MEDVLEEVLEGVPEGVLNYPLELKERPVKLGGKMFKLVELTGTERESYFAGYLKRVKKDDDGKPVELTDYTGLQTGLVSLALCHEDGKKVGRPFVEKLPGEALLGLYNAALELSAMTEEAAEESGNE